MAALYVDGRPSGSASQAKGAAAAASDCQLPCDGFAGQVMSFALGLLPQERGFHYTASVQQVLDRLGERVLIIGSGSLAEPGECLASIDRRRPARWLLPAGCLRHLPASRLGTIPALI